MDTKNNRGNSSLLLLGIIASGLMTLKVTNHFSETENVQKNSVVERARDSGKQSNKNTLILAGSLMRYKDVKALDDSVSYEEKVALLPNLYPDPYLPIKDAKLKIINGENNARSRFPGGGQLSWRYSGNTLRVEEKGFKIRRAPTLVNQAEFTNFNKDEENEFLIKSVNAKTESAIPLRRKDGRENRNWKTKLGAKLRIPPPPMPECRFDFDAEATLSPDEVLCLTVPGQPEITSTDPITGVVTVVQEFREQVRERCSGVDDGPGGDREWDLHVRQGTEVTLDFLASGVIKSAMLREDLSNLRITGQSDNDYQLDYLNGESDADKAPFENASSVLHKDNSLDRHTFSAEASALYVVDVVGVDGSTFQCDFAINVNDLDNSRCGVGMTNEVNAAGCGNAMDSFVGSTKILMADGTNKTIDSVKEGDFVWNPILEKPMKVSSIASRKDLVGLIEVIYGDRRLTVTGNHPIATVNRGYVPAVRLKRGDIIFMASGESGEITKINNVSGKGLQVYDLFLDKSYPDHQRAYVAEGIVAPGFERQLKIQNEFLISDMNDYVDDIDAQSPFEEEWHSKLNIDHQVSH